MVIALCQAPTESQPRVPEKGAERLPHFRLAKVPARTDCCALGITGKDQERFSLTRQLTALLVLAAGTAAADCYDAAAERHRVPADILRAIACVESNHNPHAVNRNRDGSVDYGVMQINSSWLTVLSRFGIERDHLWDPCTNVHVGAWVLAQKIQAFGFSWRAIGAYNAGLKETAFRERLRYDYAKKVYSALDRGC